MQHMADSNIRENLRALLQPSIYRIVSHLQQQNAFGTNSVNLGRRSVQRPPLAGEEVKVRRVHLLHMQSCCQVWIAKTQVS
jgi:hypothetical protein